MKYIAIMAFLLCFISCKNSQKNTATSTDNMEKSYLEVAKEELGASATCEESSDQAFVLCRYIDKSARPPMTTNTPKSEESKGFARIKYFVWNTSKGTILKKDVLTSGKIEWHSNTELKITEAKGYEAPPTVYLYDVVTQKRRDTNAQKH